MRIFEGKASFCLRVPFKHPWKDSSWFQEDDFYSNFIAVVVLLRH